MGQVFITKKQLQRLFETGSNSAAMDLDIYVQPVHHDTSNGNNDLVDVADDFSSKLEELKSMFETGKKIKQNEKSAFFSVFDNFTKIYDSIKNTK